MKTADLKPSDIVRGDGVGARGQDTHLRRMGLSDGWRFYAVPTSRVIFTVKTNLDLFSLGIKRGRDTLLRRVGVSEQG